MNAQALAAEQDGGPVREDAPLRAPAMDALIGHTGFVGSHLAASHPFGARFSSATMEDSAGASFDLAVCAAAPGSMFEANRFPDRDARRIEALIAQLGRIRARRFILISSIAVLADPAGGDDETTTRFQTELAYGRHRRQLEVACAAMFPGCLVLRLPALFGRGLRKNFVFDLLNPMPSLASEALLREMQARLPVDLAAAIPRLYRESPATGLLEIDRAALEASGLRPRLDAAVTEAGLGAVQFTSPDSTFQYYDMTNLWRDIGLALDRNLAVLHLPTEPVAAGRVHQALTGRPMPATAARRHREDMRTRHAGLWGRQDGYIAPAQAVIDALRRFAGRELVPC